MKNQPGLPDSIQDQNLLLITNCPSSWLKPFTVDATMIPSSAVQAELKCSPMSDGSDQPMSLSSSEQQTSSEEDEGSEAETYPLLSEFNNKQLNLIADVGVRQKKNNLTMNGTKDSAYQYQNFDPKCSITGSTRWNEWSDGWCPTSRDMWFSRAEPVPQNAKSNDHNIKFSPNPMLETTELANNNRNGIKYTFDSGMWHDSAWSRPRRTTDKSPTSSSKSFEDMIVDVRAISTLCEEPHSQAKMHINMNSNTVPSRELNHVGNSTILTAENPFERYFTDAEPVNSNMSLQKLAPLSSAEISGFSSNVSNNSGEIREIHVQPLVDANPQPNLRNIIPIQSSPKNVNFKTTQGLSLPKEIEASDANGKMSHNFNEDDKILRNAVLNATSHLKRHSTASETSKKCVLADDVNLVTRTFNNFSLSSSKQKEILRLLQERRKSRETNISESKTFNEETKILNIQANPLSNHNVRRRFKKIDRQLIADGLVLEKVRYDPNWKRRNRILCTSDEVLRHFGDPPRKDVNVPTSVPTQTSTFSTMGDSKTCKTVHPEKSINSSSCNPVHVPEMVESPTDNVTLVDNGAPVCSDINSNKDSLKSDDVEHQNQTQPSKSQTLEAPKSAKLPKHTSELFGDFDVYNIETTMPTIDWAAMEAHLARAAEEDDWLTRRRNDREEIRKRLALGTEEDEIDYYCGERVSRKPSLSTRLQSGMNLQICFMNETASDQESPVEESERDHHSSEVVTSWTSSCSSSSRESSLGSTQDSLFPESNTSSNKNPSPASEKSQSSVTKSPDKLDTKHQRPSFFFAKQRSWRLRPRHKHEQQPVTNEVAKDCQAIAPEDFYTKQARLQAEARLALAQAKEMAKMQMEVERQKKSKKSPIADIVGLSFPDNRHRYSRQLLLDMNVAQLQVIVNDLHSQIESHNEDLVHFLLKRDDLHMEQDSMLVDIEDLTRYLGAKEETQLLQQLPKDANDCKSK